MKFVATPLAGAMVVELERHDDERGYFARSFCRREFAAHGLAADIEQCNVSFNRRRHTLRGLHLQRAPHQEAKLVRCIAGAVYDVIVDLRAGSPTFRAWFAVELTAAALNAVYVPPDFAHGFLSLTDDATVLYQMNLEHHPEAAAGLRWNDPALGIAWPASPAILSPRDASYPLLENRDE